MHKGIVIKSTGSNYLVKKEGEIIECKIRGRLRIKGIKSTNPVTVGDWVKLEETTDKIWAITGIEARKNYLIRKSVNLSKQTHILASNIDMASLIVTLKSPVTYRAFIDRFLVSVEAYNIPASLIFNKTDLYDENDLAEMQELMSIYEKIGYKCIDISVKTGRNIDRVKDLFKDKVNVVSGHSGAGKSSLINALDDSINLKVGEISDVHNQGKHTTTFSEMKDFKFGGSIIDTPGIKAFGLAEMEKAELSHYFPEIFKLSEECKYNNCTHTHEPGCVVKEAVEEGEVSESRYNNYVNLFNDDDEKYR